MEVKPLRQSSVPDGYKQTEVGVIPKDWLIKPLGSFCEITAGRDLIKEDFSPASDHKHAFPIYSNALTNGGLYGYSKSSQYEPNKITVSARGDIGHAVYRGTRFCAIGRLLVISSTYPCDLRFVTEYINHLVDFAHESTGVPQLTAPQISKYVVALPPTKVEQEAIAETLSDADALIESLEQLLAKKRQVKQGAMQELLTGKKRLPGFESKPGYKQIEVGVIPEDWKLEFIENLAHITTGSKNTQDRVVEGQYPFFVRSQVVERINSYSFDGEAVLTAGDGVGTGKVFHYINGKFDAHQRVYRISEFSERISGYFFYLYFSSHFYARIMQMTAKSSVDSVRREMIARMLIPLPPSKGEQTAIAVILSDMDAEIAALEAKLAKARQLKQGMMQELLTGRIRLVHPSRSGENAAC